MAHTVEIKEIINGVQITETIDGNVVEKLISYQSKPFLRTTNESAEETYQVLDIVGEIYNTPALATVFRIIDKNDNVFIPANRIELIEYSLKIRAFRPDDDEDKTHTGLITTTSNSLTINLASDNVNWAYIDGSYYERYYPDTFNFTPVTTGQKIIIVYAVADSLPFRIAQGAESTEAVEPTYDGLFVARLLVTDEGINIEEATAGFKLKANDGWANIYFNASASPYFVSVHHAALRFNIMSAASGIKIGGINFSQIQYLYDGVTIYVRNETAGDLEFLNVAVTGNQRTFDAGELPLIIKQKETATFAYHAASGVFKAVKMGSEPDLSGYATTAQLTTEKNRNDTQDGQIADLSLNQIEITTTGSITTNTLGTVTDKPQHMRSVLVKNGVNAINITLETSSHDKFEAIYYKKGSAAITFVEGAGATLVKVANDGILNGAVDSNALVYRDGNTFYLYISNY